MWCVCIQLCETYDMESDQWTPVTGLFRSASCQSHVVISDPNLIMLNNEPEGKDVVQVLLFGGHSFSNDRDHYWLQRLTLDRSGWWLVRSQALLSTHGVLYYTATHARLPVHYLRRFV